MGKIMRVSYHNRIMGMKSLMGMAYGYDFGR